jgi:hypothetical protein
VAEGINNSLSDAFYPLEDKLKIRNKPTVPRRCAPITSSSTSASISSLWKPRNARITSRILIYVNSKSGSNRIFPVSRAELVGVLQRSKPETSFGRRIGRDSNTR